MSYGYIPVERFVVDKVAFYVIGTTQPADGPFALLYEGMSNVLGRPTMTLALYALTDQETSGTPSAMDAMYKRGRKYLKNARKLAQAQSYLVTRSRWMGIIHPDNLAAYQGAVGWKVWEFLPEKFKRT